MRIGLFGPAGSGKDSLYEAIQKVDSTYQRVAFGDAVKAAAAPDLLRLGINPDTMTRAQKNQVRPLLERIGDQLWDECGAEWLRGLPTQCVNTRIQRGVEASAWVAAGGVLVEVIRTQPATDHERLCLVSIRRLAHRSIYNTAGAENLLSQARWLLSPHMVWPQP